MSHETWQQQDIFILYNIYLVYTEDKEKESKRKRHRKVIWFNPPYSANVHTMLQPSSCQSLISIFKNTCCGKYFNRSNVKVSYSCMGNMESLIAGHNRKIIRQERENLLHQKTRKNVIDEWVARCPLKRQMLNSVNYIQSKSTNNRWNFSLHWAYL